jgi:uncharacterized membrane protein YfcA
MKIFKRTISEQDIRPGGVGVTSVPLLAEVELQFPAGATLLTAQMQNDVIAVWALCPEAALDWYVVTLIGTGMMNDFEDVGAYLATIQMRQAATFSGYLVLHLFWRARS